MMQVAVVCVMVSTLMCAGVYSMQQLATSMQEHMPEGWVVADLSAAVRAHYTKDELLEFALLPQSADWQHYFVVDSDTGLLKVKTPLDRDVMAPNADNYVITLLVALISPDFEPLRVQISIDDVNDNTPSFPDSSHVLSISESSAPGKSFPLPLATDPDSGSHGINKYRLLSSDTSLFSLQEVHSGTQVEAVSLQLLHSLDRETTSHMTVYVLAVDGGSQPLTGTLTVHIVITDTNDHSPVFDSDVYEVTVTEDTPAGSAVASVHATDADDGANARLTYTLGALTHKQYGHIFAVNSDTGEVVLQTRLRYDVQDSYTLTIECRDLGAEPLSARTKVKVDVVDVNDHAPEITLNPWGSGESVEVAEEQPPATFVAFVYVDDKDGGVNGDVSCELDTTLFTLSKVDGSYYKILTSLVLDRETRDTYSVRIACSDRGTASKSTSRQLLVKVKDVNDNAPVFDKNTFTVTIPENVSSIDVVTVNAVDSDFGDNARITYYLENRMTPFFTVDSSTGRVRVRGGLDYEKTHSVQLTVYASDAGKPQHTATAQVTIHLIDINDEAPAFDLPAYTFRVREGGADGVALGYVTATDKDGAPFNSFLLSLADDVHNTFSLHPTSGLITVRRSLDRETRAVYRLIVTASDLSEPRWNTSVEVTVHVDDVNDNAPRLYVITDNTSGTIHVPASARRGYQVIEVGVKDADVGNNALHMFSVSEDQAATGYFRVHPYNGVLSLDRDVASLAGKTLRLNVTVQDGGSVPLSDTLQLLVVINSSLWHDERSRPATPAGGLLSSLHQHELAIIMLTSATGVLVTILIMAIVCLKMKQQRGQAAKPCHYTGKAGNYTSVQQDMCEDTAVGLTHETYPMMRPLYPPDTSMCPPADVAQSSADANKKTRHTDWQQWGRCRTLDTLPSPPQMIVLGDDTGSLASSSSINDSIADSGRGGSEEGGEGMRGRRATANGQLAVTMHGPRPAISSFHSSHHQHLSQLPTPRLALQLPPYQLPPTHLSPLDHPPPIHQSPAHYLPSHHHLPPTHLSPLDHPPPVHLSTAACAFKPAN